MGSLDATRAELAFLALYLSKAETRDKICRAIQYGSKFISGGESGVASQVDKSTSLARKVFRLLKSVNELQSLVTPAPESAPSVLVLLGKSKNALMAMFLALDNIVWLGRTGIYKDKERAEFISKISLYCWLAGCICSSLIEISELARLSSGIKKLEKDLKHGKLHGSTDEMKQKERRLKLQQSNERALGFVKASLDLVVAVGLLQLAPKKVTPRVTGAFGFASSLISCYQLLPSKLPKAKTN